MRALPVQAKPMLKVGDGRFNDLANAGQPPPPRARPGTEAVALGRTDHLYPIGLLPVLMPGVSLNAFIGDLRPLSGSTDTAQARFRAIAQCEERLGQGLVLGPGRRAAKTGNHTERID